MGSPSSSHPRSSGTPITPNTPYSPFGGHIINPVTPEPFDLPNPSGSGLGNLTHIYSDAAKESPPLGFTSRLVKSSRDRLSSLDKLRGIRRSTSPPEASPTPPKKISKTSALHRIQTAGSHTSFDHPNNKSSRLTSKSAPLLPLSFETIDLEQAVLDAGEGRLPQSKPSEPEGTSPRAVRGCIPITPLTNQRSGPKVADFTSDKSHSQLPADSLDRAKKIIDQAKGAAAYDDDSDSGQTDLSGELWNRILNSISADPEVRAEIREKARNSGVWAFPSKAAARKLTVNTSTPHITHATVQKNPLEGSLSGMRPIF